jgi:hypothetical protein
MSPDHPIDQNRALIERAIEIDASPEVIFESILEEMLALPDGKGGALKFKLEAYPGGRWYRDLGNNAGHFWGHVQVIKPPTVLEIYGPLMISSPAVSHVAYRVKGESGVNRLTITHRIFGDFDPKVPEMVGGGWQMIVENIRNTAQKKPK